MADSLSHEHKMTVCEVHDAVLSQCRCMSRNKTRMKVPCPGTSCPGRRADPPIIEPESLQKAIAGLRISVSLPQFVKAFVNGAKMRPPSELRKIISVAVMDQDPGVSLGGEFGAITMSSEQVDTAVLATLAVLIYHQKVPDSAATW